MAQHKIPDTDRLTLQYNLIRSHASGAGKPIDEILAKGMLVDRLNTFALGKSGVHPDLLLLLRDLINLDITPVIYEHGGVGASGDLVQLAHLALAIIGEGELMENGKYIPLSSIYRHHLTPFAIRLREGIAMMNGTSCMTGIGLVNLLNAKRLLSWSILISASINEALEAYDDHISAPLNAAKHHTGQNKIAEAMRRILKSSKLLKDRTEHLYKDTAETHFLDKVQEYYSLRCMPQILGPILDTIEYANAVVTGELNSLSETR